VPADAARLRRTGVTPEEYDRMFAKQESACGNSRERFGKDFRARIDRAPDGSVRGLLCPRCRVGLSTFRDDVDRLRAAVGYVEQGCT
jgi:hypothetical protein